MDSGQFPRCSVLDEHPAAGIACGQITFVGDSSAIKIAPSNTRRHLVKVSTSRNRVFPPTLDIVQYHPTTNHWFHQAHSDDAAPLRAAPDDNAQLAHFARPRIQRCIIGKRLAHLPNPQIGIRIIKVRHRRIGESVEDKWLAGRTADVLGREKKRRGDRRPEKDVPHCPSYCQPLLVREPVGAFVL